MRSPLEIYGELFVALHASEIWDDGKFITDAIPLFPPSVILSTYLSEKDEDDFDLEVFFDVHFQTGQKKSAKFTTDEKHSLDEHIRNLWNHLKRSKDKVIEGDTLIALPHPYIVPGGRFNEIYYWDSYFTMLGLKEHGETEVIHSMIQNFKYLIDTLGYIPNGNRSYFISRSQPPFFALMVELLVSIEGEEVYSEHYDSMKAEYSFWMDPKGGHYDENTGLNRYYDKKNEPREEMYGHDAQMEAQGEMYRHMRAACESGWDFSSRWFEDTKNIETIKTLEVFPIDLHCLLYKVEIILAGAANSLGNEEEALYYMGQAQSRRAKTDEHFWDENAGFYFDKWSEGSEKASQKTLAGVFPLFVGLASDEQGKKVSKVLEREFLRAGGLVTTLVESGQQWDGPNGWPPLQWVSYISLVNYGEEGLAQEVATRWCTLCETVFKNTGKMMEKYNVEDISLSSGGGEYPVQDGFGWSNGVWVAMKSRLDI